jgi:hypothetical protein
MRTFYAAIPLRYRKVKIGNPIAVQVAVASRVQNYSDRFYL